MKTHSYNEIHTVKNLNHNLSHEDYGNENMSYLKWSPAFKEYVF